jgi:hypothetical protein
VISIVALRDQLLPPNINFRGSDPALDLSTSVANAPARGEDQRPCYRTRSASAAQRFHLSQAVAA